MKTWLVVLLLWPALGFGQPGLLFPADANNDGRANALDLLAIGLNYGKSGPPRFDQTTGWSAKVFQNWPTVLPVSGVNAGFSDTNGDGTIDTEDVLPIKTNYDSSQNSAIPPPLPYNPMVQAPTTAKPRLVFAFDKDTAKVGDTVRLHIAYVQPPGLAPAMSPMGVSFELDFDESLIQDNLTRIHFEPAANDLMFAAGAAGFADARVLPPGKVEFAAAGRRVPALSFSRPLGVVDFVIEEIILRADTFYTDFKVDVSHVLFLDTLERKFNYDVVIDELVLYQRVDSFAICPGDANNDGQVNALDVLAIGLNYGQAGLPRKPKNQGMAWGPKPYSPWIAVMPGTKINLAFSDSDGDGKITGKDVAAIQLNYDSLHHLAYPLSQPYAPPPVPVAPPVPPRLLFEFAQSPVKPGDTLVLVVRYEPPNGIPSDQYPVGVAFALTFPEDRVQDSLTRIIFPPDTTLLAAGGATQFALARSVPRGRVEAAVSGKGLPTLLQAQELCRVAFVIEKNLPSSLGGKFSIAVDKLLLINTKEQEMTANTQVEDAHIVVAAPAVHRTMPVACFPSPLHDRLWVRAPDARLINVQVSDVMGRLVGQSVPAGLADVLLDAASWPTGLLWVQATADDGRSGGQWVVKR